MSVSVCLNVFESTSSPGVHESKLSASEIPVEIIMKVVYPSSSKTSGVKTSSPCCIAFLPAISKFQGSSLNILIEPTHS